ncbi:MAG: alpha/beta hydrolase [Mycobacterium sp.]
MPHALHIHRYGPPGPFRILAIHGLGGHGQRWRTLATQHLPDIAIAAPDLIGHGRSSYSAPWTIDANVTALADLVKVDSERPVLVVGHSFGGAVALNLAAAHPNLVSGLVLLDPAVGLDGDWMREIAEASTASPDYTDRDEARIEKITGSWADVPVEDLEDDLDEHLVPLSNGRYGWRVFGPAIMSYWSELARGIVLPHNGIPTTLVRASLTRPPYVSDELIDGLTQRLGAAFNLVDLECRHMVSHARPHDTASIIRTMLS